MTYKYFIKEFINPYMTKDRGYNNQLFNDVKDMLHREKQITERQANEWVQPDNKFFRSNSK